MNSKIFSEELAKIKNRDLRKVVTEFIERAPDYIEHVPASSSGMFHPHFDQGEGGLVRHLKMCVVIAEELMRLSKYSSANYDAVTAGCILHDMYKNGYTDSRHTVLTHDIICATEFKRFAEEWGEKNLHFASRTRKDEYEILTDAVYDAIRQHMGQWGTWGAHATTYTAEVVVMSDYIASRKFFDIYSTEVNQ